MSLPPDQAITSYIDALLSEDLKEVSDSAPSTNVPVQQSIAESRSTASSIQSRVVTPPQPLKQPREEAPYSQTMVGKAHTQELEQTKKAQLQALLFSRSIPLTKAPVVTPDPVKAEPVKPDPVKAEPAAKAPAVQIPEVMAPQVTAPVAKEPEVTAPVAKAPVVKKPEAPPAPPVDKPKPAHNPMIEWADNGRPKWAQESFDVLLFRVAGLTLAVPLITLGHIHNLTDSMNKLIGQADWFMGMQQTPDGNLKVVNTALFVMPDRYSDTFLASAKYVISINGLKWGLAVDEVQQPKLLKPDEVTWRSQRSKRPWLAGTVKSAMCALIDVPQMGLFLEQAS